MRFLPWCLTLGLATGAGIAAGAQVPRIFEPQSQRLEGPPLWISAEDVADPDKGINLEILDDVGFLGRIVEQQRRALGEHAEEKLRPGEKPPVVSIPYSECSSMLEGNHHRGAGQPSDSLAALAGASKWIIRGTIRSVTPGFSSYVPSSLLEVDVSGVIKGSAAKTTVYVDYLVAHFRVGPFRFCNLNRGFEPRPNDELLFFVVHDPIDRDLALYRPRVDEIFFQRGGEPVVLPPRLKNTEDLKRAQTLDEIARLLVRVPGSVAQPLGGSQ